MTEQRNNINIMKYWPIVIAVLMLAGTWAKIQSHLSDQHKHVDEEKQVVLTKEEYKNLLRFAERVENEFDEIGKHEVEINKIKTQNAVHQREYEFLLQEHEDLEGKHSRDFVILREDIIKKHN